MGSYRCGVVIVAGGSGKRMGSATPKQFMFLDSKPILAHTINLFAEAIKGAPIIVVLPEEQIEYWRNLSARFEVKAHHTVAGGKERFDSVKSGLQALFSLGEGVEFVAIHDGVRPLASPKMVVEALECAAINGSAIPVIEATDSFRVADESNGSHIIDRKLLRAVQTPQIFDSELLRRAYRQPYSEQFTDDASVVEAMGESVTLCKGERSNIKITTAEDLIIAEALLTNLKRE